MRNKIRHLIVPAFQKITNNFQDIVLQDILHLQQVAEIYHFHIKEQKRQVLLALNDRYEIDIQKLKKLPIPFTYLYEFVKEFGFNADTVQEIISSLDKESGKQFYSLTYCLLKDRDKLIITRLNQEKDEIVFFDINKKRIDKPVSLKISVHDNRSLYFIKNNTRHNI